jgi:lipoprotein-anchoring transpeptidase ErfK/SrfK
MDERAQRLRREAALRRRQLVAVPIVAVALIAAGVAVAWRSSPPASALFPSAASVATPTVAAQATGTVASSHTTASVAPTASAAASGSADVTATPAGPSRTSTVTIATIKPLRPAPGVKTIVVDKSEQRVTMYKADGTPVDTFRCSSGVTYPRIGTYKVYGHRLRSWSIYEGDDSTFYYFTTFEKSDKGNNIGFHSIPQHPDGSLVGKLGVPVSHGCVRLAKDKAKLVYAWAVVGTRVVIRR